METNTEPKPKKFTQSDFRLLLGKQLIGGFTSRKIEPTYKPLFEGPDITTPQLVNHENYKIAIARGCNCRLHKKKFGVTKCTVYGCRACSIYLCKECHYQWHRPSEN